jgi:molecular chaperone GrpE
MMPDGMDPTSEAELDTREVLEEPDRATMTHALRELEAAKQRVERHAHEAADELRGKLVLELVPVLDNLDRTISAAIESGDAPTVLEGAQLVRNQLEHTLLRYGVERVEARHRPFDPAIHDALSVIAVPHPSAHNVVVEQIAPGYRLGERLLRPARVVVGRYTPRYH